MNLKRIFVIFLGIAVLAFVVTAVVTYLYSLVVHGAGVTDWGTAFRTAIILGIVLTFTGEKKPLK
jgi:uncharacterized membrane protein YvlD (DUF360 family)